jgi:hypothetical protein
MKSALVADYSRVSSWINHVRRPSLVRRLEARLEVCQRLSLASVPGGLLVLMVALALALFLRLHALDTFVTVDEHSWALRSLDFRQALLDRNFAGTYRSVHPGVITMWLGTLASLPPTGSTLDKTELLFAARPLVALLTWLCLVALCWMVFRIWGPGVTLLSAVLIGLDPFYLAHSRLLHVDGLSASLMVLSLLSLMVYLIEGQRGCLLLSAVCGSLATLSKSTAGFIFPFGVLLILLRKGDELRSDGSRLSRLIAPLALWTATATMVFVLCWPAMWVRPLETLSDVAQGALRYARTPHEGSNFFMGEPRPDPGAWFYPVVLLFRLSPFALVGAFVSLGMLFRRKPRRRVGSLHLYVLLFCVGMTMGDKKFDRYVLPVFPVVDLIAAIGWTNCFSWVVQQVQPAHAHASWPRRAAPGLALPLMVAQLTLILPARPHYLSYYNPLAGGGAVASRMIWVGWGEGLDRAAQYLNGLPNSDRLRVMSWYAETLKPHFDGQVSDIAGEPNVTTDYFVLYANQVQRYPDSMVRYCGPQGPEHTVILGGAEYAWVCSSAHQLRPLVDYIQTRQQPGDALVADDPSPSLAHALDMPYYYLPEYGRETGLSPLDQLKGVQRAWYVYLPGEPPGAVHRELAVWGHRLDEKPTKWGQIALYRPPRHVHGHTTTSPVSVQWRSGVVLTGLAMANATLDADQAVGLSFRWRVDHSLGVNVSLGLRVLDAEGHVWGTVDRWLLGEDWLPTSGWEPDRVYATYHLISLLEGIPPGRYRAVAELADGVSGQPLEIEACDLPTVGTSIRLAELQVVSPARPLLSGHLAGAQPAFERLGEGISLTGTGLAATPVKPGDSLPITLVWQAERQPSHRYAVCLQLRGREGGLLNEWRGPPVPAFPTDEWRAGEIFRGQYEVQVPADALPGRCQLRAWLEPNGKKAGCSQAPATAWVEMVEVEARDRVYEAPASVEYAEEYVLGGKVRLLGYSVEKTKLMAGESVRLTLYWQSEQQMGTSWKVFTHLLDGMSRVWGQWDSVPMEGTYPTTGWLAGEVVRDEYDIPIRSDAPAGHYRLEVGMYDPRTGSRLGVVDEVQVAQEGDRALLGVPIEVVGTEPATPPTGDTHTGG